MDQNGRFYPDCPNAANPYHECGTHCLQKISGGKGRKEKNPLDNGKHIAGGKISKKEAWRKGNPSCPKASNPYHECDENCLKRNIDANSQGFKRESGTKILDASRSFGRKKKGSDAQSMSPKAVENIPSARAIYPADSRSPQSHFSRKKLEENGGSFTSSGQGSEETASRDHLIDNGQVQSTESVPMSGKLGVTALLGLAYNPESVITSDNKSMRQTPTESKVEEKTHASDKIDSNPKVEDEKEEASLLNFGFSAGIIDSNPKVEDEKEETSLLNFGFSAGISKAGEGSNDEEVDSVISDSYVSVGKYHVKASVSSVLQSILDNYGDVAANCHLESTSMRTYYLECLCAVVQELESTPFKQLTKSKIKEMFAFTKDVESAGIDVNWLHDILNEISEAIEYVGQNESMVAAKAKGYHALESTRKELESQMEDLSRKEKEAADARERVAEIKERLSQLELEYSQLGKTISSVRSVVKKYGDKSAGSEVL